MNKVNYSRQLEQLIEQFGRENRRPTVLLHSCCAPCSSAVMEYLREYFDLTVFFYNPNITMQKEYEKRRSEEMRLIGEYNRQVEEKSFGNMHSTEAAGMIGVLEAPYDPESFFEIARGLENCPEGSERCFKCYRLRLRKTAQAAAEGGFDFFTTTLTISPLKNAEKLNTIGQEEAELAGSRFLPSDFKKKEGFLRSIKLSGEFGLYRQNFCGCIYSRTKPEKPMNKEEN